MCFLQPFRCRKTVSLVPFQYFLIYALNISKMITPTNLFYKVFPPFLSLSENSMKCISFCEKHLLVRHINKSEKGKCLWYVTLVTHCQENLKCTEVVGVTVDTKIVLYELLWLFLCLNYNIKRLYTFELIFLV